MMKDLQKRACKIFQIIVSSSQNTGKRLHFAQALPVHTILTGQLSSTKPKHPYLTKVEKYINNTA